MDWIDVFLFIGFIATGAIFALPVGFFFGRWSAWNEIEESFPVEDDSILEAEEIL